MDLTQRINLLIEAGYNNEKEWNVYVKENNRVSLGDIMFHWDEIVKTLII